VTQAKKGGLKNALQIREEKEKGKRRKSRLKEKTFDWERAKGVGLEMESQNYSERAKNKILNRSQKRKISKGRTRGQRI